MVLFYRQRPEPEAKEVSCQRAPPWPASHKEKSNWQFASGAVSGGWGMAPVTLAELGSPKPDIKGVELCAYPCELDGW